MASPDILVWLLVELSQTSVRSLLFCVGGCQICELAPEKNYVPVRDSLHPQGSPSEGRANEKPTVL